MENEAEMNDDNQWLLIHVSEKQSGQGNHECGFDHNLD